jgi:hypothetical protein
LPEAVCHRELRISHLFERHRAFSIEGHQRLRIARA